MENTMAPKWLVVAKNEYRIRTSIIRKIRPIFPYIVVALLALYVFYIIPSIFSPLGDLISTFLLSQVTVAMMQIGLFLIFFYFLIIPITSTLREQTARQLEIFLSAPIKSSDILLGEFLGTAPLYAIIIVIFAGLFTGILAAIGLSIVQLAVVIIIVVIVFLSAFWIGTVIAAVLRTKLEQTARGKDIGRGLAMLLVLPLLALFYMVFYGGILNTLADPKASGLVKTLLGWLPSSWGAEVIFRLASTPGDITAIGLEGVTRIGGLLTFFVVALYIGIKVADRAYTAEPTRFTSSHVGPDNAIYRMITKVVPSPINTIVVSLFKDYIRHLENISNITYIIGLLVLMVVFIAPQTTGPDEPPGGVIMLQFILPLLAVMVTGDVTVKGKQTLFIYRKAPAGEQQYVTSMIMKSWLVVVPLTGVLTALVVIGTLGSVPGLLVGTTGVMMVFAAGVVVFVMGLFLLNPAFSEKSIKLWINVIIVVFVSMGLLMVSFGVLTIFGVFPESMGDLPYLLLVQSGLVWVVGIASLFIGRERFIRIE
jgi:hypothetical protein